MDPIHRVFLVAMFWGYAQCQMIARDEPILILKNIFDRQGEIMQKLDGQQIRLGYLKESLKLIQESLGDHHQSIIEVTTKEDLQVFQNASKKENRELMSSIERISCQDEISTLTTLLTTDECEKGSHNCSEHATCQAKIVGFQCHCLPGFSGDGFSCEDLECKTPSLYIPDLGCITPVMNNKGMSWNRARQKCEETNTRMIDGFRNEHISIIAKGFQSLMIESHHIWIGVQNGKWLYSDAAIPDDLWGTAQPVGGSKGYGWLDIRPGYSHGVEITPNCHDQGWVLCQFLY